MVNRASRCRQSCRGYNRWISLASIVQWSVLWRSRNCLDYVHAVPIQRPLLQPKLHEIESLSSIVSCQHTCHRKIPAFVVKRGNANKLPSETRCLLIARGASHSLIVFSGFLENRLCCAAFTRLDQTSLRLPPTTRAIRAPHSTNY